ncbi:MAG: hypothetical protein ABR613_10230 [Actinomycetota bacterium]
MSDVSGERTYVPIEPARHVSARELTRETAKLLRAVADEGHSFAIRHFGRVVAFLVPLDGRVPKMRRGRLVYEVEVQKPLMELSEAQLEVLRILAAEGAMADPTESLGLTPAGTVRLLATMAHIHGLLRQRGAVWEITPYGARHLERRRGS